LQSVNFTSICVHLTDKEQGIGTAGSQRAYSCSHVPVEMQYNTDKDESEHAAVETKFILFYNKSSCFFLFAKKSAAFFFK
jgi:hypothetical protein